MATSAGPIRASRVILATGGLSVPATGSDGIGLGMARKGSVTAFTDTYPGPDAADVCDDTIALGTAPSTPHPAPCTPRTLHPAPCTLHPPHPFGPRRPIAPVRLRRAPDGHTAESSGGFLFTHRGYSGPAVLDVSHVCVRSERGPRAQLRVAWTARLRRRSGRHGC